MISCMLQHNSDEDKVNRFADVGEDAKVNWSTVYKNALHYARNVSATVVSTTSECCIACRNVSMNAARK